MAIGVFDSGLGGLTVLAAIRRRLPTVDLVYLADSRHAPYGPRPESEVTALSAAAARFLREHHGIPMLVLACNTATSAAAEALRTTYPALPVVGMEPGIKPAVALSKTRKIAVLATRGTVSGTRFAALVERFGEGCEIHTPSCEGWVERIEAGDVGGVETRRTVASVIEPLVAAGVDTLVLGCTHFPLLKPLLAEIVGPDVAMVDTSEAVARHVERLAREAGMVPSGTRAGNVAWTIAYTTGAVPRFERLGAALLGSDAPTRIHPLFWNEGELSEHATHRRSR